MKLWKIANKVVKKVLCSWKKRNTEKKIEKKNYHSFFTTKFYIAKPLDKPVRLS